MFDKLVNFLLPSGSFSGNISIPGKPIPDIRADLHFLSLDFSGSMYDNDYPPSRREAAILAAEKFMESLAQKFPNVLVGAGYFTSNAGLLHEPVHVGKNLSQLKDALRSSAESGGTDMYKGFQLAESYVTQSSGFRQIIALTDGHTCYSEELLELSNSLKVGGVQVDCIGIGGTPFDVDEDLLRQVASTINGQTHYWFIKSVTGLIQRFQALAIRSYD